MPEEKTFQAQDSVLVIGGGVGGIQAAIDLSESGKNVLLVDKAPAIGGLMTQLDRTFPTNNCDICTVSPHLSETGRSTSFQMLTMTRVSGLEGSAGDFSVTLKTAPRYIDLEKCTACGDCLKNFPDCVRYDPGLDHRAPTCMRYPKATPQAYSIDMGKCSDVQALVNVCKAGAIIPEDQEKSRQVAMGSIVLAPGAAMFDADKLDTYGHAFFSNVVTGLEYERILSASGPTSGQLVRPSDGEQPKKIAWIQCVGSRNINQADVPYCNSVCCMYALKEAIVTKQRFGADIETVVFYMDMRTFGKDYERYYQRAKNETGIRFVNCRPHSVDRCAGTDNLMLSYLLEGESVPQTEEFDMVVLSTGFVIPEDVAELGRTLGIELNDHRFASTSSFSPVASSKAGIYVCGLFESPKDIPETLIQASAAACLAGQGLQNREEIKVPVQLDRPERDVLGEDPNIGVFVFECGFGNGSVMDADALAKYAAALPGVTFSAKMGPAINQESLAFVEKTIQERNLNRVVIGAGSPRTQEPLFQETLKRAGLNKYLLEIANIQDQGAWVHESAAAQATEKGKDLIRMAVASVALARPLEDRSFPANKDVLVVGGGVAGMNSALALASQGRKVTLLERSDELGGIAANVCKTLEGEDVREYMKSLIDQVSAHQDIEVLTGAQVVDHSGVPGMFQTGVRLSPDGSYRKIEYGAGILATGALANRPKEYLLGDHDAAMTQLKLDRFIESDPDKIKGWKNVVMIQCVGSRVPENPNCSRVCCQAAVKNALRIKELNPDAQIFVLNRDVRTYGFQEDYYRKARERGVVFVRYSVDAKPVVSAQGETIQVEFTDPILSKPVKVAADCLALSTGFLADTEGNSELARIFRLPMTEDGYLLEEHIKLRPTDLPTPGFFIAGAAHAPKLIRESIAQAQAAAGRALTVLAKDTITVGASYAEVESEKCAACLICVRACPFDVPVISGGYSFIDPAKCHGCGVCVAECPAKAIQLMQFEDDRIMAKLDGLLEGRV